jgi:hypothetical protein
VTTSNSSGNVVVNTALIVKEVIIDSEGSLHRSVVVQLILDAHYGGWVNSGA